MTTVTVTETINAVTVSEDTVTVTPTEQVTAVTVNPGISDHGQLSGLADDDHTQYLLKAGGTMVGDLVLAGDPDAALKAATKQYVDASVGITDHGQLSGLGDDDHTQYAQKANNLSDLTNAATARTNLGVAIGSDVQAHNAALDAIAALTLTKGNLIAANDSAWVALGVGADGQVLTADAASAAGVKWAAGGGGGGASDVDDLTTNTGNATEMVRVDGAGTGLEYRTAAQVLADIGAAASADLADYLPLAGGTLTGNITVSPSAGALNVVLNGGPTQGSTKYFAVNGNGGSPEYFAVGAFGRLASASDQLNLSAGTFTLTATGNLNIRASGVNGTIFNTAGNNRMQILATSIRFGDVTDSGAADVFNITNFDATKRLMRLKAMASQTADFVTMFDSNLVALAQIDAGGKPTFRPLDAVTAAITNIATLGHNSTGTPAAGFGGGLLWQLESSTTENRDAARIAALWQTATDASRKADLVLSAYDTAEREFLRGRGNGSAAAVGFLGATPVARAAHIADASGDDAATVNAILVVLENLGFIATS